MRRWLDYPFWQLAIISGVIIGLSYPMLPLGFLAWIGFIPLIHILLNSTPRNAFSLAYLAGSFANLVSLYWIGFNSGAGIVTVLASLVGAILYLGVFWAIFGWLLAKLHKQLGFGLILWPFLWVAMEYARSFGPMGFPWINLATTQAGYLPMIQMVEFTGSYGIGFWVILVNVYLYEILINRDKQKRNLAIIGTLLISIFVFGIIRMGQFENGVGTREFTIAIVQPNINPTEKWDSSNRENVFALMDSTLEVAQGLNPDLVLWPESAVPAYLRLNKYRRKPIERRVIETGIPLLTGTVDKEYTSGKEFKLYNGSMLISPDGNHDYHHKIQLVPFAEYIPMSWKYPQLKKLNFGQGNFDHGTRLTVFEVDSVKFSNLICYESSFPQLVRKFVKKGARLMTIETNDAWVGQSSGPYQHFAAAILRAVENRVPIARSANTGISGFVKPSGRTFGKIPMNSLGIEIGTLAVPEHSSFYARFGDVFAIIIILIGLIISGLEWKKKYQK